MVHDDLTADIDPEEFSARVFGSGPPDPAGTGTGLVLAPFRGVRFAPEVVGDLAAVTALPGDLIDDAEADGPPTAASHSVVRLILPKPAPGAETPARHREADAALRRWLAEGALIVDPEPALYVYEAAGEGVLQRGLIGAVGLRPEQAGVILPHENVSPGPVHDRLALMSATRANLEPIFLLYDGGPPLTDTPAPHPTDRPHTLPTTDTAPRAAGRIMAPGTAARGAGQPADTGAVTQAAGQTADTGAMTRAAEQATDTSAAARAAEQAADTGAAARGAGQATDTSAAARAAGQPADTGAAARATGQAADTEGAARGAGQATDTSAAARAAGQPADTGAAARATGQAGGTGAAARVVEEVAGGSEPVVEMRVGGVRHRLWRVTDPAVHTRIAADLRDRRALVADGHHRYAAYLMFQARRRAAGDGAGPWDRGLALLVDSSRYPARLGAAHRVLPGLPPGEAVDRAKEIFHVTAAPAEPAAALRALAEASGPAFLVGGGDGPRHLLTDPDPIRLEQVMPADHSARWRRLDTAVLDRLLIAGAWNLAEQEHAVEVIHHDPAAAFELAGRTGGTAVILNPLKSDDVLAVAEGGERVPRKSTSFGPKPRTGLVFRLLDLD